MVVYVLDIAGNPLMPTQRFGHVRRMLGNRKAKVVSVYPYFVIQLTYETTNFTQSITLGVDAGSIHIGTSATTDKKELQSAEIDLRSKQIKRLKDKQRGYRRTRRSRLRHRQPRFNNRVRTKKKGWLAPSMQHRVDSHVRIIDSIYKILPVTLTIVEVGNFDTQKMSNPDISGVEYQNGQMTGYDNTKAFVRFRDKYTCQQCGVKGVPLEIHHIIHKEDGGSDRPDNLITLCHDCHHKHHNEGLVLKKFRGLDLKNAKSLRDTAAMNIIKDKIMSELKRLYPDRIIWKTYGYITNKNRREHKIEKSHANDAFVITRNFNAKPLEYSLKGKQVRRHNRKIYKDTILKGGKLKRNQTDHLMFGFALNDRVRFNGIECFVHGRRTEGYFDLRCIDGTKVHASAPYRKIKLIRHENGIILGKIKRACVDSSGDAEDVAVSSALLL